MDAQEGDWRDRSSAWDNQSGGYSVLRIALLFSSIAIAIAMLAVPLLQNGTRNVSLAGPTGGVDMMATGSIRDGNRYTIRRSVLQPSRDSICVIRENGSRAGSC